MIISAWNPTTEELEKTNLSATVQSGATSLTVKNTDRIPQNNIIMIGEMGMEQTELSITVAPTTTPDNRINLNAGLAFAHASDEPVYRMRYDEILFYRSTSQDGAYELINSQKIDVDNKDKKTYYQDTMGSPSSFYKTKYRNSITFEETEFSDYISAEGYKVTSIGSVIGSVVRRIKDMGYAVLTEEDYLDLANEVNDDIKAQSERPYMFMYQEALLDRVANQDYIELPEDYVKFDFLEYVNSVGGYPRTKRLTPISRKQFDTAYGIAGKTDMISRVTLDGLNKRILLKPTPRTSAAGAFKLWYYAGMKEFTDPSQEVQTPSPLIYRYKFLSEAYTVKSEVDPSFAAQAQKYEAKYGNELMKMQRMNRQDVGSARSFMDSQRNNSVDNPARRRYDING